MSSAKSDRPRLLVFNCHEAWLHQLSWLGLDLDIVVGLKGRHVAGWDEQMRPVPPRARLLPLAAALQQPEYHCIIAHNITDLLDVKEKPGARLTILHGTIEGRVAEEKSSVRPDEMGDFLRRYLHHVRGHAVAVSELKAKSWGVRDVVRSAVDESEYLPHSGELAIGLRISNLVSRRRQILRWELHEQAFAGLPMRLVGHNPDLPGVAAASDWGELKRLLASHRFYVHTAALDLEDGFNMASMEAMAAGLPVLSNVHPTTPIVHGESGFLSDDPSELRSYAERLLAGRELAAEMGAQARKTAHALFSRERFVAQLGQAIETARQLWRRN